MTEYAPGIIRLRNDIDVDLPKRVWAYAKPQVREFELTFHWTEMKDELGQKMFEFCNAVGADRSSYPWELFRDDETYPHYAWTPRARQEYRH